MIQRHLQYIICPETVGFFGRGSELIVEAFYNATRVELFGLEPIEQQRPMGT